MDERANQNIRLIDGEEWIKLIFSHYEKFDPKYRMLLPMGAAFLLAKFGFDGDVRSAGYIASWIELLKADKRTFFTACNLASKAADYLRGLCPLPSRRKGRRDGTAGPHIQHQTTRTP